MKVFDIFISYRRIDENGNISGRDIARTIKKEFQLRGYNAFFDYSEIQDNAFEDTILPAIKTSKIFLLVLTKKALVRCSNSEDWVRREILTALQSGCKIIPICPQDKFDGWPDFMPTELDSIKRIQISDIHMGSLFEVSMSKLIKDRIEPVLKGTNGKNNEKECKTNDVTDLYSADKQVVSDQGSKMPAPFQIADDLLPYNYQPILPSFFSRILLFDKAFSALAIQENEGNRDGFLSLLASECLDLLEFLFLYGNHPDLEIRKVSITKILSELKGLDTPNSRIILSVIAQDLPQLPSYYSNTDAFIFLFHNEVIGCTSPLTIVFTSPQCKSIFQSWSDEFRGVKGQLLFKEHTSFKERGKLFQEYFIRLLSVCHYDKQILQYVRGQSENALSTLFYGLSSNKDDVNSIFTVLKDEHGYDVSIVVEQDIVVRLGCVRPEQLIATEYCIQSNRHNSQYRTNTEEWKFPLPLVLNDHGILGAHYIKDWPQGIFPLIDEDVCKVSLNERILPGTSLKYPYLVAEDFFEDRIVQLEFNANREKFFLLGDNENTYLPPIKPFYFRYFDLKDLITSLHYQQLNDDRIEVTLDIPVAGNGTKNFITLRRVYNYSKGDLVSINNYDFRLSVWPDYRLPNDKQNLYSVSVGEINNVRLKFISLENSEMEDEVKWHQIADVSFCSVNYFDAIQLSFNDTEALLFPLFKMIDSLNPSTSPLKVGIDLGSSTTRICYTLYNQMPQTLEILSKQVMNLNQFHDEIPGWKSELTEMRMVRDEMREIALPPYLPAYERSLLYTYIGLKPVFDYKYQETIKDYCDQLAWLLKNQIINDSHDCPFTSEIKVNLSLPSSISAREKSYHFQYWHKAFQRHFGNDVQFKIVDDTLSLHTYTLWAGVSRFSSTTLLLDIGKRNSSIAIYDTAKDMLLSCSYLIGIGDLWENELLDYRTSDELYRLWMRALRSKDDLETSIEHYIEKRMQQHANWMDYLFVYASELGERTQRKFLDSYPDWRAIHFLLVASIIWKAVQDITPRIEIEHLDVVVAGGGFMPLQCFMGEHDLKTSIIALLSHFSNLRLKDLRVVNSESTFAKAEGAAILDSTSKPINTKVMPLCDNETEVSKEADVVTACDDFSSFIHALREFDATGLPLDLSHICDLFEQYAHHGTRLLQAQYKDDYLHVQDVFFWPLKGSFSSVIREII